MIDGWTIYWLTRLDALNGLGLVLLMGGGFAAGLALFIGGIEEEPDIARIGRRLVPLPIIGGLLLTFAPTTKEAAAIIVLPAVANSEEFQGLGADLVDLAREWVKELKPTEDE